MKPKKSVRRTIFRSFTLLLLAAVAVFSAFFYLYISAILRDRAISALSDSALSLARSIDVELAEMNNISLNVTDSALLKRLVAEHSAAGSSPALAEASAEALAEARRLRYLRSRRVSDIVVTIIGPLKPVPQVNLYSLGGGMIGAGIASGEYPRSFADMPWYPSLDLRSGSKLVSPPARDALLDETFALYRERSYVSLVRAFFGESREPVGVVEVKQFYDEIFKDLSGRKEFVAVLDGEDRQIYPFQATGGAGWGAAAAALRKGAAASVEAPGGGGRATAVLRECRQIGWRVVVARPDSELFRPLAQFGLLSALAALLVLAGSALAASRLARRITTPLGRVRSAIASLEWKDMSATGSPAPPSGLDELEELEAAFGGMRLKLGESVRDLLDARTHELRATMLALQSQMDPHFIHNMLTVIGIMAEERQYDSIREAIGHLTHLLRYISSGSSSFVTLAEEAEYARRYLACMRIRFGAELAYGVELEPSLAEVLVPKLVIQPLVENSIKHGMDREPPWSIGVSIVAEEGGWRATVTDDGPGFPAAVLARLTGDDAAMTAGGPEVPPDSLGIGGLGLRNIAARLRLCYGEAAAFSVANGREAGARVTIGGSLGKPQEA